MSAAEKFPTLVNSNALDAIVEAGGKRGLVAAVDIFDEKGTKLWARDRQISAELRERLQARRLRQPLESSLRFADGLNASALMDSVREFLDSGHVLAQMVEPWASAVLENVPRLSLQPVAELMLTTMVEARPTMYAHAARGMALAGAMALRAGESVDGVQLAMLGGLLHDLGELYLDRSYLDASGPLDLAGYRRVAAHPRVSQLLLSDLGGYPQALSVAVSEHHERLDGSGYPRQVRAISALGRLLAVMEATLGILSSAQAPPDRAAFALRVVPGEFDATWLGFVTAAARRLQEQRPDGTATPPASSVPETAAETDLEALQLRLQGLHAVLAESAQLANELVSKRLPDPLHRVSERAVARLERIRASWNALGLWSGTGAEPANIDVTEASMALREIGFRLSTLRRDCLWPESATLTEADLPPFDHLWSCVQSWVPPRH